MEVGRSSENLLQVLNHNESLVRSLKEQGLETIAFDDVKYTHQQIGEGFWGEVFKIQSGDNTMVLKISKKGISSGAKEGDKLSINEVEIMRKLDHPNIVKFLGCCVTDDNHLHPLLEYINGGTLEDFLQNDSIEFPWITRFTIASNVASGMKYLHNHGIMHRDLTSSNILLRITESADDALVEALISDFGLAKDMRFKERTFSQVGSVDWMAPEVILGKQYNKKADVFSYGIILCEMIGRCEADPETSVIRSASFEVDFDTFTKRSCEGCPPQFLDLAKSCCQLDPEKRHTFDRVYEICSNLIDGYSEWEVDSNRRSIEKLNISGNSDINSKLTVPNHEDTLKREKKEWNCKDWDNEPRFSLVLEEIKMLSDEDSISLRSFKSSTITSLPRLDEASRRASLINPIPSVNRNSGKIVLTIRNDACPFDARSPEIPAPQHPNPNLLHELARLNERDEIRALRDLSENSTLVLFDPASNKMRKRRSSDETRKRRSSGGKQSKNVQSHEVPFGRRQFSKKKKIRPVWKSVFGISRSPKHEPSQNKSTTAGLINFFKNLGSKSNNHNNEPHHSGKSKISKRYTSEDTLTGHVTRYQLPPASPKHKKNNHDSNHHHSPKHLLPRINTSRGDPLETSFDSQLSSPNHDLTPTNHSQFWEVDLPAACTCGACRECRFREGGVAHAALHRPGPGTSVSRNESYRSMKPMRSQSQPPDYLPSDTPNSHHYNHRHSNQAGIILKEQGVDVLIKEHEGKGSSRGKSLRDRFLPDRARK